VIQRLKPLVSALFYCLLAATAMRLLQATLCLAIALSVLLFASPASRAAPGEFTVASCQADSAQYSVHPFTHFVNRGMVIRYACTPTGPGLRGVVTQNAVRRGRVKRGSAAQVTITAPPGTRMTSYSWAGVIRRRDCRYALQIWAEGPGKRIPLKNVKANRNCPRPRRAQAAQFRESSYSIPGATRITQRVTCVATRKQNWCSTREANYIKTERASVVLADTQPPTVAIQQDTPLTQGAWVSGPQQLNYTALDNVGVQQARALLNGQEAAVHGRDCLLVTPAGPFSALQPCPNGPGQMVIRADRLAVEGTQQLVVEAQDPAGYRTASAPVTVRIDRTPPPRVDVSLEGSTDWRASNRWIAVWVNPDEGDRAPITAVTYELCAVRSTSCTRGTQAAPGIARLPFTLPEPGEWTLSLWRRDAAGNEDPERASVPVTLRYDPDPPQLAFAAPEPTDPTLVVVRASDELSGLADGAIDIASSVDGSWQALPTHIEGGRVVARIDDAALAPGTYLLRARARDRAGNEAAIDRHGDGRPTVVTLPLRKPASIRAGFERVVRRPGKGRRQIVVLRRTARAGIDEQVRIAGRLADRDGRAIAGASLQLLTSTRAGTERLVETLTTNADGRFRTATSGVHTRTLRMVYSGSLQALPSQQTLNLRVPAATSVRASRHRLRNGQAVTFRGRVRGMPMPADGKLVEIQVRFTDRWQTFRTTRSDAFGRWSSRYRFQRTRGVQNYRFRVRLPEEAGFPFETSVSRTLAVQVSGR
jgi:hypothetical protein